MGCCMSTTKTAATAATVPEKHEGSIEEASLKLKGCSHESRAPPPYVEEETVKEVLSETPKPKPKPKPKQETSFTAAMKQDLLEEEETKISAHKVEAFAKIQEKQNMGSVDEEIMSEVSEICSVSISISESLSTVTNVTDMRGNEEEEEEQEVRQRQRVTSRSPAKQPPPRNGFKRDRVMNKSPARRSEQSPARRIGNGAAVKGPARRDHPGESSRRRSRSPTTSIRSSAAMGQSPSARRTNGYPGRVSSGPIENSNGTCINSSRTMEGMWASSNNSNNNNNENCSTNETLENPLVSLECFIFL